MDEGGLMTDENIVSLTTLASQIADLRAKAEAHAHALSHLHGQLRELEGEMLRRQRPPEDWE
jgi:hypothetical protein